MASRIAFSAEELARITAVLPQFPLRDQALFQFGLHTGFRARELGALTVGHVWDNGALRPSVSLERRSLKNGRGVHRRAVRSRTLPLTPTAQASLARYIEARFAGRPVAPGEPLFRSRKGRGLSRWQVNCVIHRVAQAAGCAHGDRIGAHSLRKTFAQGIYSATGKDINLTRAVMGHASVLTTIRYLETSSESAAAAVLALDRSQAA